MLTNGKWTVTLGSHFWGKRLFDIFFTKYSQRPCYVDIRFRYVVSQRNLLSDMRDRYFVLILIKIKIGTVSYVTNVETDQYNRQKKIFLKVYFVRT